MNIKFKKPKIISRKLIEKFFIKKGLKSLVDLSKKKKLLVNQMIVNEHYEPDLEDL